MLNFAQRLEQHLSGCDNLPEQAIRPQLRRPPWKRAGARSHSMGRELRAHFITFKDPRYKSDRARCQHCLAEVCYPLRSLERHIAECEHFTEGITRPQSRKLLPEDKPIAKKKPVLVAEAREIRSHFMSLDEHTFRMPRLQCRYCKSDVRDHLLNLENHISTCKSLPGSVSRPTKLVQCQGCHRGRIPEHELATHIEDCPTKYCRHCNEFIPRAEMGRHATSCAYYRCEFCWLKMLRQEIKAHITDCPVCRKCRSLKGEPPHICTRTACGRCRQRIPAEVFETHVSACQWLPCPACLRSFESEVDLADHFQLCAEKARLARFEKAEHRIANPRRRLMNKLRQEVKDDAHTTMENSKKSHQSLSALLLSPTTHYPETPEICAVRDAWMNNPYTTVVVDFEYIPSLAAVLKHQSVFQMAFSNAKGEWIVPPTMINHDMSVLELVEQFESALYSPGRKVSTKKEKSNKAMCVAMVAKFYGPPSDSQTKGLTWEEIANIIDHYARVCYLGTSLCHAPW